MSADMMGIALTGLRVAQSNLMVVSNNVSNVNTPGYSRQTAIQSTNQPNFSGAGYIGQGAFIQDVQRIYNEFLGRQALQAGSAADGFSKYATQVGSLLNRIGSPTTGINAALDSFYAAVQDFAVRPSEVGPRQAFLGAAETLTARFRSFDEQLSQLRSGANQEIEASTRLISQNIRSIAEINERIVLATATAQGKQPNDLLDQRDVLLRELARRVDISIVPQDDGAVNVFLSNGQTLVVGNRTNELSYQVSATDPRGFTLRLVQPGPNSAPGQGTDVGPLFEGLLQGGELGALLSFVRIPATFDGTGGVAGTGQPTDLVGGELYRAQTDIGRLAITVAAQFNRVQQSGVDLLGNTGQPIFGLGSPAVFRDPSSTATGPVPQASFTSTADLRDLEGVDYLLRRDTSVASGWRLLQLPAQSSPGAWVDLPVSNQYAGLSFAFTGVTAANGEEFLVSVSQRAAAGMDVVLNEPRNLAARLAGGGISDNRNGLAMAALATTRLIDGFTLTDKYSAMISGLGTRGAELEAARDASADTLKQIENEIQSFSGVNLDEEAAKLIKFQQAYGAAGKLLATSSQLFQDFLAAIR